MHSSLQCDAYGAPASSETTWTMRTSFPEYVVALATIVGSVLFTVWFTFIFGGVGIACLPLGLIFSFIRRPKAVITRSQYIKEATELGKKAKELKKAIEALHQEERSGSKGRKWRKNVKSVEKVHFDSIKTHYLWGGTLMNSFLFNVGLILLCSIRFIHPLWVFVFVFSNQLFGCSVIQFCSTAFAYYSQATAAQEIFGHTLQSLRGIKYLYK
ncbi:hypothetical protein BHE74_00042022 [Ensete ventricosum]|nr:hypothetical protein GW17_00025143 [Ensete ventricosum]RWW51612.1 hypothetical protein BHE74_00042022 [Ensete ventricosum]RZS19932.1 hypothetical protein BHM03_00052388 [Ensete ventricosum]